METVEVVIKLPKEVYEGIQQIDRIILGRRSGKTIEFALWNGVKNGIPLPKRHGWIPVSERLPETDGMFLTYIVNPYDNRLSYIMICDYIRQTWCPVDETASSNVVAWMPLPEPYKAESEDKE